MAMAGRYAMAEVPERRRFPDGTGDDYFPSNNPTMVSINQLLTE